MPNPVKITFPSFFCLLALALLWQPATQAQTYPINWRGTINCQVNGTQLHNHLGGGSWDAGAYSNNVLYGNQNGSISWTVTQANKLKVVGFSVAPNVNEAQIDIEYGFRLQADGTLAFADNGAATQLSGQSYAVGDLLKVRRTGSNLELLKNGTVIHTVVVDPTEILMVDAAFKDAGGQFDNIVCDFSTSFINLDFQLTPVDPITDQGQIILTVSGGENTSNYDFTWAGPGIVNTNSQNQNGLAAGTYTVSVTDAANHLQVANVSLGYAPTWTDGINMSGTGNLVKKVSPEFGWDNEGIQTHELLYQSQNGWVEYTVDASRDLRIFSLCENPETNLANRDAIEYGFYLTARSHLYYWESGAYAKIGDYETGDRLRIERTGPTIVYLKNGVALRTISVDANEVLTLRANFREADAQMEGLRTSFKETRLDFQLSVTNIAYDGSTSGAADAGITGGTPPYTYTWSGGSTGATQNGLTDAASQQLTVTDALGRAHQRTVGVGYAVNWLDFLNTQASNGQLIKNTGLTAWDAGASTNNLLDANDDGWVEYTIENAADAKILALTAWPHTGLDHRNLNYGFYLHPNRKIYARWLNPLQQIEVGTYVVGDVLRMEKIGNTLYWKRNGTVLHQRTIANLEHLIVQARINNVSGVFSGVRCSFPAAPIQLSFQSGPYNYADNQVAATVSAAGGTPPYTYLWSTGHVTESATYLNIGEHCVTVTDAAGQSQNSCVSVGHRIQWHQLHQAIAVEDGFEKTSSAGFNAQGISVNELPAGTDGWVEFTADQRQNRILSFKELPHNGFSISDQDYGIFTRPSGELRVRESGVNTVIGFYHPGDRFRLERQGTTLTYYQNGEAIRTVTNVSTSTAWVVDGLVYEPNEQLTGVRAAFGRPELSATAQVYPIVPGTTTGAIDVQTTGGTGPISILWNQSKLNETEFQNVLSDFSTTTGTAVADLNVAYSDYTSSLQSTFKDGLHTGLYPIKVVDAWGSEVKLDLALTPQLAFDGLTGMTANNGSFTKTANDGWQTAGVNLWNLVRANEDGWVRARAGSTSGKAVIGFSPLSSGISGYDHLAYGFLLEDGAIRFRELGETFDALISYDAGDLFHVAKSGNEVQYFHNGQLLRSSAIAFQEDWVADADIFSQNFTLLSTQASGPVDLPPYTSNLSFVVTRPECGGASTGSIQAQSPYSLSGHTFTWNQGVTGSSPSNLSPGVYNVTITNASGVTTTRSFDVDYLMAWAGTTGPTQAAAHGTNDLVHNGPAGYTGTADAANLSLPNGNTQYFTFDIDASKYAGHQNYTLTFTFKENNNPTNVFGYFRDGLFLFAHPNFSNPNQMDINVYQLAWQNGDNFSFRRSNNNTSLVAHHNGNVIDGYIGPQFINSTLQFSVTQNTPKSPIILGRSNQECQFLPTPTFGHLKPKTDASYYTFHDRKLRFKYQEEYAADGLDQLKYRIYEIHQNQLIVAPSSLGGQPLYTGPNLALEQGNNWFTVDLLPYTLAGGFYLLEVEDPKGEKSYLKFKI